MNLSAFITSFWRVTRPLSLAASVLLYALGGGIANYLGDTIKWPVYWLGLGVVIFLQLSSFFLREYFDRAGQPDFNTQQVKDGEPLPPPRIAYLQIAMTTLTIGAVFTVLMISSDAVQVQAFVILGITFVLALAYAMPPLDLGQSGYGELALSILQANLFPALAFLLQAGELHRLLALVTFPLTFLYLSTMLALSLQSYLDDLKRNRRSMMSRLGWQRGMNLHNLLIVLAYLLLSISMIAGGLPWRLAFPAFFSLPVGIFQIWQMNRIASGAKPRWRLLSITAIATLVFTVYFLTLALWTT